MTIVGIGIDIIDIIRVQKIILNYKEKFAKRILSKYEWQQYIISNNHINFLAKRFSIKEAASKALGIGICSGIKFNQIELYHDQYGKPKIRFFNNALIRLKKIKCNFIHISITDEKKYVYSLVILEE